MMRSHEAVRRSFLAARPAASGRVATRLRQSPRAPFTFEGMARAWRAPDASLTAIWHYHPTTDGVSPNPLSPGRRSFVWPSSVGTHHVRWPTALEASVARRSAPRLGLGGRFQWSLSVVPGTARSSAVVAWHARCVPGSAIVFESPTAADGVVGAARLGRDTNHVPGCLRRHHPRPCADSPAGVRQGVRHRPARASRSHPRAMLTCQ